MVATKATFAVTHKEPEEASFAESFRKAKDRLKDELVEELLLELEQGEREPQIDPDPEKQSPVPATKTAPALLLNPPLPRVETLQKTELRVAVHGVEGQVPQVLLRMLEGHPFAHTRFLSSQGMRGGFWVSQPGTPSLPISDADALEADAIDLLIVCTSDDFTEPLLQRCLDGGVRVIDLSHHLQFGDEREDELSDLAYGLTELSRGQISEADIVVNPGSHSTCIGLALAPLGSAGQLQSRVNIQNCSRGIRVSPPLAPLSQESGQVEQEVEALKSFFEEELLDDSPELLFQPQHAQAYSTRGLRLAFLVGVEDLTAREVHELYRDFYLQDPFIRVLPWGDRAVSDRVLHTNRAEISIHPLDATNQLLILASIDALFKGVVGQALQNLNVMFQMDEEAGLSSRL